MDKKVKKSIAVAGAALGTTFLIMRHIAKKQNEENKYADSAQQNPLYHKRVVFVENPDEPKNADGKHGHLEAVGDIEHTPTFYEKYVKRGLDIVLSFGGMLVLSPVIGVTSLAIKTEDPGSPFFKQKRIAQGNGYFDIIKLRSMKLSTPADVPTHMLENPQQYLLRSGQWARNHSIDELGQLWNIFRGDMSVIGPRPALWNQDYLTAERDKYGANDVKPGLTGLAQISGRDELAIEEKAKLDGVYTNALKESSISGFLMDIKLFIGSISSVLRSKGIVEGGMGQIAKEAEKAKEL